MRSYRTVILIGAAVLAGALAPIPGAGAQDAGQPFSIKADIHIVVTENGLVGENGVAGLKVESTGPIDMQELNASAVLLSPTLVQMQLKGELTFTEPAFALENLTAASHRTLFCDIKKFEATQKTIQKLPGLDFSVAGIAGIIIPIDGHSNIEIAGAIAPID
jgi:hypothetical protein